MVDRQVPASPFDAALRAAWPPPSAALTVRVLEDLGVLSLRHLPGGTAALEGALSAHALAPLPKPGACHGSDPWLVWTSPTECLLLSSSSPIAEGVLQALAPGHEALACALDLSAGYLAIELLGPAVADVLPRLFDASAIPRGVGQGSRARLMDISAVVLRVGPDQVWLLVDRAQGAYVAHWITHALGAVADPAPTPADPPG